MVLLKIWYAIIRLIFHIHFPYSVTLIITWCYVAALMIESHLKKKKSILTAIFFWFVAGPPNLNTSLGQCDRVCNHCKALFWYDKRLKVGSRISNWCLFTFLRKHSRGKRHGQVGSSISWSCSKNTNWLLRLLTVIFFPSNSVLNFNILLIYACVTELLGVLQWWYK